MATRWVGRELLFTSKPCLIQTSAKECLTRHACIIICTNVHYGLGIFRTPRPGQKHRVMSGNWSLASTHQTHSMLCHQIYMRDSKRELKIISLSMPHPTIRTYPMLRMPVAYHQPDANQVGIRPPQPTPCIRVQQPRPSTMALLVPPDTLAARSAPLHQAAYGTLHMML